MRGVWPDDLLRVQPGVDARGFPFAAQARADAVVPDQRWRGVFHGSIRRIDRRWHVAQLC
ncbi:hypothetical protein D3C76_1594310 [compost metagenome]